MSLKLLNPLEAINKTKQRKEGEDQKLIKIQALIAQKYRELADAEKAFDTALARQSKTFKELEQENAKNLARFHAEVTEIENRRAQALIPLETREKELDTRVSTLDACEKELERRASDVEEMKVLLQTKLDETSEHQSQLIELSQSLKLQKEGIERQSEEVKRNSEGITHTFTELTAEFSIREKEVSKLEAQVAARLKDIEARENGLKQRELAVQTVEVLYRNYPFESPIKHGIK